jgi:hypothetical protein
VSDAYSQLADLAEIERDLAVAGRVDEVLAVQDERAALIAGLPAKAPAEARPSLRRAAAAQAETTVALATAMRAVRGDAVRLEHMRGAVAAYHPAGEGRRGPSIAARG